MSRTKDTLALLKGLQLIAKASAQTNEEYLRHLWANSSVRDVISSNCVQAKQFTDRITRNPNKEFENVTNVLKETVERSSVVAESLYRFGVSQSTTLQKISEISNKPKEVVDTVTSASHLDISAITLKELEQYLSNQYDEKDQQDLAETESEKNEPIDFGAKPSSTVNPKQMLNDEKYVKEWMQFISEHKPSTAQTVDVKPKTEPIVESVAQTPVESQPQTQSIELPALSAVAKQRKVPSTRFGRMASFGTLFAGLGLGTVNELAKGALGLGGAKDMKSALFSSKNAERIVDTLCRVRGAALKLGQILSIQDSTIVSPHLVKAFDRVRQAADYMPDWQVEKALKSEFGSDWRLNFKSFEDKPFAAASIGQVHRGILPDGMEVAIKIQYPGVAKSIESDIDNLVGMLKVWDVFPAGIFIDNVVKVAKRELIWEVDYLREANYTEKYREMAAPYKEYRVPKVIRNVTTKSVLTTELVPGVPLDKCFDLSEEHRKIIATSVLKLCLRELFEFRCMQTDPNWSNFLYDVNSKRLTLIDFGSTRFYTDDFINDYKETIRAAVADDYEQVLKLSQKMKFLTGYETKQMKDAHVNATMILGELFRYDGEFDFGRQSTTKRIAELVPTMIAHRLCPPPEEIYSIHRKLSGVFLLCSRLNVKFNARPFYEEIVNQS
ncbi:atypical kinase COQ8B, mitochondrial [Sitodiplosis mosellana]|uniref:atypical kinase COQ8B, mitochondrial n=1 Tax=Sitodiplosis mosellana TaxID=263140 RepID=UPI00244375CB|nr:atypical kinase COQ8B, mitochondrial [Sitodiplosis mosellana]